MNFTVTTKVRQPFLEVMRGFDQQLFVKLSPPFPKVELIRFDGCKKGDVVDMKLSFGLFHQKWESHIVADDTTENYFFFKDVGKKLPFFLKSWQHRHWVKKIDKDSSVIIDDIHFSTGSFLSDLLMLPVLKAQFLYRKPIYRKFFAYSWEPGIRSGIQEL